jgi:folate-binding Fe-S cluster repair protein YgfZ
MSLGIAYAILVLLLLAFEARSFVSRRGFALHHPSHSHSAHSSHLYLNEGRREPKKFYLDYGGGWGGLLSVTGEDRLSFLQGLGTNDFIDITEEKVGKIDEGGTAFTTAFLNGKGQLLGSAQVLLLGDCVKLLVESPAAASTLKEYFEKYLFPLDRVKVEDISKKTRVIHSLFPQDQVVGRSKQHTAEVQVVGESYRIVGSNGLCVDGLSLGGDTYISEGDSSLSPLLAKEDVKTETIEGDLATQVYEDALQLAGQASVMNDLVPYNITALEAGFMASIHFRKGCFVGNEVVSKQVSTKAIRRHLVGLRIADDIGGGEGLKAGEPVIDPDTEEVVGIVLKPPRALSTTAADQPTYFSTLAQRVACLAHPTLSLACFSQPSCLQTL